MLPSGVDPRTFFPRSRAEARRELGWKDSDRVVLFNRGHDSRIKGFELALRAMEEARRRVPDLRMEILDGEVDPSIIPTMMNAADCLLMTSDTEGSPTVVQEALACDLPVVSVHVGDIIERLRGVRDTTVAPRDPAVLGAAVARMVNASRRTNGHTKIDEFCAQKIATQLKEIYLELAGH